MSPVLKYFFEEPVLLEPVTPDADPDARRRADRSARGEGPTDGPTMPLDALLNTSEAHRGYLAGTDREADRVGLTALPDPGVFTEPVMEALGGAVWQHATADGTVSELDANAARAVLRNPTDTSLLVTAGTPAPAERITAATGTARRHTLPALRALLDAVQVAFFPEPAHDGHDWSFFSNTPMRDRLVQALRNHPTDAVRRFVCPYQKARSESKFYFETWQLTEPSLPDYIEEV